MLGSPAPLRLHAQASARGSAAAESTLLHVRASASREASRPWSASGPAPCSWAAGLEASANRRVEAGHRAGPRLAGSGRRALFTAGTLAVRWLQALPAVGTSDSGRPFVACARGGGAKGRPPGSARGRERDLGSLSPSPCSGPRPDTDGARRAPGVVVQPRLAPGATRGARRQWIATPATSSSGCSWSSAPWPCCSLKVSAVGLCTGTGDLGSRPSGLVSGGEVPAFAVVRSTAPGPGALKDSQTLGRLARGELLNSGPGDDQTPLGSRTPTGRSREHADPNWAEQASLLLATKFLHVFLDV